MNASPLTTLGDHRLGRLRLSALSTGDDFQNQLRAAATNDRTELHDAAAQLVATSLVLPALTVLQESPLRPTSGPFATTAAEKRFGPLLNQQFADRITTASNFGLVDSIVDRLMSISESKKGGAS